MKIQASLLAGLIAAAPGAALMAQETVEVATDPVGYVSVELTAASDTRISVPMHRAPSFQGIPESVDENSINFPVGSGITPEASAYFIAVRSGDLDGLRATVLDVTNDGDTIVVDDAVDLSGLAVGEGGDSVQVIPHWTLSTLFPDDLTDGTEVLVFDVAPGINRAPTNSYVFSGGTWMEGLTNRDDTVIHQGESIIVRDDSGSDTPLVMAGSVPMFNQLVSLHADDAGMPQDNFVALTLPVNISLGESGLGIAENMEILIPDNQGTGINKAPSASFVFNGTSWMDGLTNRDDFELEPGVGYIVRLPAGTAVVHSWGIEAGYTN